MADRGRWRDAQPGVALWCPTLMGVSRARGLADKTGRHGEILIFSGSCWLSRLALWVGEVDEETTQVTRGIEISGRELSPWNSVPLETLLARIETPWIEEALDDKNLTIHLQPILWVDNLTIVGFEALARSCAEGRSLNGGELVRAATAHGSLNRFERLALMKTAEHAYPKLVHGESLFVNILPDSLQDADAFEMQILKPLCKMDLDMTQVVFEIVESDALPPMRDLMATIGRIRAYGSLVAVDDLGAGCAAFTCIVDIEPDVVKLDKSLLSLEEASECGIIQSLTSCAHSVGALVVAEGIETIAHFELIRHSGVDMAQGWYIGRPAPEPLREFGSRPFMG